MSVRVMLRCNDDRGNPTGRVDHVELRDHREFYVRLDGPSITFRAVVVGPHGTCYRIGRRLWNGSGMSTWVGNVYWNSFAMPTASALRLLAYLLERGYEPEDWTTRGPFAKAIKATAKR